MAPKVWPVRASPDWISSNFRRVSSICARHFAGPSVATIYGTIYATNALGAAFGSLMGGVLHDLTGGYRSGLVFSLAFIALALAPFWTVPALRNYR